MKLVSVLCLAIGLCSRAAPRRKQGGKTIPKTHDQPGNRDARRRLSALWQRLCRGDERRPIRRSSIEPRNTKGSNENIPLLEAGQLDLALVAGEPAYEAFIGNGRPPAHLKILTAIYSSPGMFVVRADSPYRTIRDLVGQPVAFGAKGSGLPILSRYVLDGLGLKQDEDFQSIYLDRAGDGPEMVLDGRVAALWGAGIGWPGFAAVARAPGGARFIAPDADEIARIRAKHSFLKPLTVPAGSYPNQSAAIASVGLLELHPDARRPARRRRLPAGAHAARRRGRALRQAAAGLRDHGREHGRGRAEARS